MAVCRECVDQFIGEPLDARPQLLDIARHEGPVDQGPEPRVGRRLEIEQRMFLGQVEGGEMRLRFGQAELLARRDVQDLPSEPLVAQQRVDLA